jgi:hypothetical protein
MCKFTRYITVYSCGHHGFNSSTAACSDHKQYLATLRLWHVNNNLGPQPVDICLGTTAHTVDQFSSAWCRGCVANAPNAGAGRGIRRGTWMPGRW